MCLAVPGKILAIDGNDPILRSGKVDFAGVVKTVNLSYVPDAKVGDYVLVHVGFAMARIDALEAERTLAILAELGEMQTEIAAMRQTEGG